MRHLLFWGVIAVPVLANAQSGVWTKSTSLDPFTDTQIVSVRATVGSFSIIVRCAKNELDAYVDVDDYLGNDRLNVRYRFDALQPREQKWLPSGDGTAVFADEDAEFARELINANRLAFEVHDFRGVVHQAVGDLPSDDSHLEGVLSSCRVATVSASQIDPSIPRNIVTDIDRWGPQNVIVNKEILQALGKYNGPIDAEKNIDLYRAAATLYGEFVAACAVARKDEPGMCLLIRVTRGDMPTSTVIYESAPTQALRAKAGQLKLGD